MILTFYIIALFISYSLATLGQIVSIYLFPIPMNKKTIHLRVDL